MSGYATGYSSPDPAGISDANMFAIGLTNAYYCCITYYYTYFHRYEPPRGRRPAPAWSSSWSLSSAESAASADAPPEKNTAGAVVCLPESPLSFERDCVICINCSDDASWARPAVCSHAFHETCITEWFEMADTCPVCRQ